MEVGRGGHTKENFTVEIKKKTQTLQFMACHCINAKQIV